MKFTRNYLGKVINTLGAQAARNMKSKRGLVSIPELISELRAKNKTEMKQLKSSVNYLIQSGLVTLVLPEAMKKSLREVGLGASELCGGGGGCCNPCCDPCCRPRLSVGVVYDGNQGLPMNQMCGSACCGTCRPRLSVGVVYPQL